jgi:hypothetical protein
MSIVFRTNPWLTLAQLLRSWSAELLGHENNSHIEQDLRHILVVDMINGRLDESGPLEHGRRLGLRLITPECRPGYLEGHQAHELLTADLTSAGFSFVSNRLLLLKEAVLDFARRHKLPPPSWWAEADKTSQALTRNMVPDGRTAISGPTSHMPAAVSTRPRGRPPTKLETVTEAMRNDIRQGGTVADLEKMLEKNMAEKYGVSRDTARKAREIILSELKADSTIATIDK